MANKTTAPEIHPAEKPMAAIETLQKKHQITRPVFAGVCATNGWKPGRAMTEDDFLHAVASFAGAPMSGEKEHRHA